MSLVECVMSYVNESCHVGTSHVTYVARYDSFDCVPGRTHVQNTMCNTLQHTTTPCNGVRHCNCNTATHSPICGIQCATRCNTLQHTATQEDTATATHCNTLQRTATPSPICGIQCATHATHCNTLQHTATQ